MANKSSIEWTDATWTPIRARVRKDAPEIARAKGYTSLIPIADKMAGRVGPHCEKVSPECDNCYSETNNSRCLPSNGTGLPFDRRSRDLVDIVLDEDILMQPFKWRKARKIFVCSQTDLFADFVPDEMIDRVFTVMAGCGRSTFQVLTKRPDRMQSFVARYRLGDPRLGWITLDGLPPKGYGGKTSGFGQWPLPNIWLGVSAGDQQRADERIPHLLKTPAAVRFVSLEPLLGPIDLGPWFCQCARCFRLKRPNACRNEAIDWVIVGGESGRGARPMHPDWVRSIRDQCMAAGVPFFFKQWGAWAPLAEEFSYYEYGRMVRNNSDFNRQLKKYAKNNGASELLAANLLAEGRRSGCITYGSTAIGRFPKKKAGRILDGRTWDEMPKGGRAAE
jgi:protein gp37